MMWNGRPYYDDRMFVLEVTPVTTESLTSAEPKKNQWAVITRRNVLGYPPYRCDNFETEAAAMAYARSVEPSTPRLSLNGSSPIPTLTYKEHLEWMKAQGIDDPRFKKE